MTADLYAAAETAHRDRDRTALVVAVTRIERAETGRLSSIGRIGRWVDDLGFLDMDWDEVRETLIEAGEEGRHEVAEGIR